MNKNITSNCSLSTDEQILESICIEDTILYGLGNDYMFHAVLQTCEEALRGLLSALLNIPEKEILSCEILNPIILGDAIDEKTCVLDIRICLNQNRQINLEMQMGAIANWTDRSLFYLCKMFTDLKQGEDYTNTTPSVQIGIVTSSPLPDDAAFYNEYAILNKKSGYEFTGKFSLRVLDLSYLNRVPDEEKNTPLYEWASVFKATTWKELLKLTDQSESIKKAVIRMHQLSKDDKIRLQCEARERYWMDWQSSMRANKEAGIAIGIAQEKVHTQQERLRADSEKARADFEKGRADSMATELEAYRKLFGKLPVKTSPE